MTNPPPTNAADDAGPERVARDVLHTTPENQAATFRNQDKVWPHRVIRRGDTTRPLPPHACSLADLTFEAGGVRVGLSDFMARRRTAGLLILKRGEIALERYGMGNGPESRWASMSTAKSITATLVGAALHDGAIGSLDDRCEQFLLGATEGDGLAGAHHHRGRALQQERHSRREADTTQHRHQENEARPAERTVRGEPRRKQCRVDTGIRAGIAVGHRD